MQIQKIVETDKTSSPGINYLTEIRDTSYDSCNYYK